MVHVIELTIIRGAKGGFMHEELNALEKLLTIRR